MNKELHESQLRITTDFEAISHLYEAGNYCMREGIGSQQCLDKILDVAITLTSADKGNIQLLDAESGKLRIVAQRGFEEPFLKFFAEVHDKNSTCGVTLHSAKREIVEDVTQSEVFAGQASLDILLAAGLRAVQSTPLVSSTGNVVGVISTHFSQPTHLGERELRLMDLLALQAADYLERKQTEERLRQAATFAEVALKCLGEGLYTIDKNGLVTSMNPAAEELFGWTFAELRGKKMHDMTHHHYRDGRPFPACECAGFQVLTHGQPLKNYEDVFIRKDDTFFDVVYSIAPMRDIAGEIIGLVVVFSNISERKWAEQALRDSEERFRMLANNMSQLAWMADDQGLVFWYNQRWYDYTGTTLHEMQDSGWKLVCHPEHVDRVVAGIQQSLESVAPWEDTFPLRGENGEFRWFLSRALPIRDQKNNVVRWFGTNTDVTEQRTLEQALRKADRRKDEFLATLAHELRNPLAPIHSGLQILQMNGKWDATAQKVHSMMERQVNHLIRLVDDLLEVSRITGGKIELRREPIELAAVIQHAVESSHSLIEAGKHRLTVSLPSEPLRLVADPVRLTQVFSNLLNNAAKYTETGGLIEILARNENGEAVVSIRDSGVGIPAEMLPHVFDLFTQVDSNLGRTRDGLGIGLAIVHTLVEMHGGRVEVYSAGLKHGSEFKVYLPLADEGKDAANQAQSIEPTASVKRRILITDDNRDVADTHAILLMTLGAEVRVVYDGQSALNALAEFKPEILLLDIGMPDMDGYETARRIRQRPDGQSIQLVALTGWGQKEDRQRTFEAGFTHHLVKPVSIEQLKSLLATSVDD